jgi:hypothetical protein
MCEEEEEEEVVVEEEGMDSRGYVNEQWKRRVCSKQKQSTRWTTT